MGVWACVDCPVPNDRDCRLSHRLCCGNTVENACPCALGAADCVEHAVDARVFGAKNLGGAMFYIGLFWVTICLLIWVTRKVDKLSAILLLPYLAWVSIAGILNFAFWALNP